MALGLVVASHVVWVGRSVEGNNSSYDSKLVMNSKAQRKWDSKKQLTTNDKVGDCVHLAYCPQKSARWHNCIHMWGNIEEASK